jgi:hypothetical protein
MCNGRLPLPASALATARNSLLRTAAISHWVAQRADLPRRPPPGQLAIQPRENLAIIAVATGRAACGKPPIPTFGLIMFVISIRGYTFALSLHTDKPEFTVIETRTGLTSVDKHFAERTARKRGEISVSLL